MLPATRINPLFLNAYGFCQTKQKEKYLKKKIAIVLPAYNEEVTISDTIKSFHAQLPGADIYVVNNNSNDNTETLAKKTMEEIGCPGRILIEPSQGKGNAIRRAFMEVEADIYVLADADMTYPAEQVWDLINPVLENRADMVVGDRHSGGDYQRENKRRLHNFGNKLVKSLVNMLFKQKLNDIMSGYRVFNRKFVKNYAILVEGFQVETDITLYAAHNRFRIMEVPIKYKDRPEGSTSKLNTLSDGARVLITISQILRYFKPLIFFTAISAVFVILGLIAAIPVMEDWVTSRYIHHVPLAILATGLEIVAVISFGIGMTLDSIVHLSRLDFERALLNRGKAGKAEK